MFVLLHARINLLVAISIIALQLSLESYIVFLESTVIEDKLEQPVNALSPIEVTEPGISIDVIDEQPWNALYPIDITVLGIEIDLRELQHIKAQLPILVIVSGIVIDSRS